MRAWTLLELLVCLAAIALLLALLAPALAGSLACQRNLGCLARLNQLAACTVVYADAYRSLPDHGENGRVDQIDAGTAAWHCPADTKHAAGRGYSSYSWMAWMYVDPRERPGLSVVVRMFENNPELPLFRDAWEWHGYRNFCCWDGHARRWQD